jgi:hypothetical protein
MTDGPLSTIAVVELASQGGLLAAVVFIIVFAVVCVVAWLLLRTARPGARDAPTWELNFTHQLPVSKPTFERIAHVSQRAVARPRVSPETRARLDSLQDVRNTLASAYRAAMLLIGLGGVAAAVALFRQSDSANMLGLPAGIVLLLSLGALLAGLFPSRTATPIEPLDTSLFENVRVEVIQKQPLTLSLGEPEMAKALAMHRQGASLDAIARSVHPQYDGLSSVEQAAVQQGLAEALRRAESV